MFLKFLSMISRYIASFCDLKKRTKVFYILPLFYSPLSPTRPRFKNRRLL